MGLDIDWGKIKGECELSQLDIEDSGDEIVIEFVNKNNVSFKLDKICNSILETLNKVIEKSNPSRGFLLNLYKPAQNKSEDDMMGLMGGSSASGNEIIDFKRPFQQTTQTKAMIAFKKLANKIDKKYKLQNALGTDKVNDIKSAASDIDTLIEDINALISDDSSSESLVQTIVEEHKNLKPKIEKLINVKDVQNDEETNPTV
jgi:hypothetical protein